MKAPKFLFYLLLSLFSVHLFGQTSNYRLAHRRKNANYFNIVAQQRQYFNNLRNNNKYTLKDKKANKQFERWAYIWKDRINPDGSFPDKNQLMYKNDFIHLLLDDSQKHSRNRFSNNTWTQAGPSTLVNQNGYNAYPGMGRINVVTAAPSNEQIMYAGAATGGVWKTSDGGNSWTPIGDDFAGMGVTDIIVDPVNPNNLFIATGDEDGVSIPSTGVFMSTNGGNNWTQTGLMYSLADQTYIHDLAFKPSGNKIFALTDNKIKYTSNGIIWYDATVNYSPYSPYTAYFQTIVFDPNNSNHIIVSDAWGALFVSVDGGLNFSLHQGILPGSSQNLLKLTASANDTNNFYGIDQAGNFMKFRYNMNNTAADMISSVSISGYDSQNGYNMAIAVSPTYKNNIIVGGVRGYVSTDNGQTFNVKLNPYNNPPGVGFYVHPDHHHLSFLSNGTTVIDGHDGGIHKGEFTANSWTDISNGLAITQSYNIAVTQAPNGDDFMMANQDNDGFSKVLKNGNQQWVAAAAGDGTGTGIDYFSTNIRYLGSTYGDLDKTTDGYASNAFSATQLLTPNYSAAFVSPFEIHPLNPNQIYAGRIDILSSPDGGNTWNALTCGTYPVSYISVAQYLGNTQICVINDAGVGMRSIDDGQSWQALNLPGIMINSLVALPDTDVLFATISGYGVNKVIRSADGGLTWTPIDNGLPNIAVKRIICKTDETDETLFLGTELGVYWKNNTMNTWEKLGQGLPNVMVTDLRINYTDQELYVGTYGRSMWKISVDNGQSVSFSPVEKPEIYPNPVTRGTIHVKVVEAILQNNNVNYMIFNVIGGVVKKGKIRNSTTNIDVSKLDKGFYALKIYTAGKSMTQKILIE